MSLVGAIVAGLVATAVMTALMAVAPQMGMPRMDVIAMLGTMVTEEEGTARIIGAVLHFTMGAIFAIIYVWLWVNVIGDPTWLWGLLFGLVHGVIAGVVMPMMMQMHPPARDGGWPHDDGRSHHGPPSVWARGGAGLRRPGLIDRGGSTRL